MNKGMEQTLDRLCPSFERELDVLCDKALGCSGGVPPHYQSWDKVGSFIVQFKLSTHYYAENNLWYAAGTGTNGKTQVASGRTLQEAVVIWVAGNALYGNIDAAYTLKHKYGVACAQAEKSRSKLAEPCYRQT